MTLVILTSNAFQNNILPYPKEILYLDVPHLYLEWFKIKWPKFPLASINPRFICIQSVKSIQRTKPAGGCWYDLLKSFFAAVKMIIISSYHAVFSRTYKTYKPIISVETYYILMATHHIICFKIITKEFDTLFYYTFQEGPKTHTKWTWYQHLSNGSYHQ